MTLDTFALQCFIAVAETRSFTRASERVRRTQSAVSQQIAKLEKILGKDLLYRRKTITLTPDGEIFFEYARRIFTLQSEAIDRFKEPELHGEVRFGLPEDFASVYLSDVIAEFSRIHPRILMNIECQLTIELFNRFKNKEFDLVLVKMNRPEDFPNGLKIWSEPLRWVGDPNLLQGDTPIPLVLSPNPCVYRAAALKALEQSSRPWRLVFTSPSYFGKLAAVKAGIGITVMAETMIPEDLEAIPSSLLPPLEETHVSIIKDRADSPVINTLEEFLLKRLKP
jgi:DNA-binding transcriptional LysR family regulator